jgi:hypothetical protein
MKASKSSLRQSGNPAAMSASRFSMRSCGKGFVGSIVASSAPAAALLLLLLLLLLLAPAPAPAPAPASPPAVVALTAAAAVAAPPVARSALAALSRWRK